MCCSITVLPLFGLDTSRPRWPLPMGAMISMMRPVRFSSDLMSRSIVNCSVGKQRGQVFEQDLVLGILGRLAIDLVDFDQREIALAVLRRADLAFDRIAGVQVESPYLRRADVDVVGARPGRKCPEIAGIRIRRAVLPGFLRRRCFRLSWPGSSTARRSGPACASGWHSRSRWRLPSPRVRLRGGFSGRTNA